MLTDLGMFEVRNSSSFLNCAVEFVSSKGGNYAWLSINNCFDYSRIKTITLDGQVLSSSVVTNVGTDVVDDWKRFGLVTICLIEITE